MSQSLICYCFSYTAEDIRRDFKRHGQSQIMARITSAKRFGGCQCGEKNPKGR